MLKPVDKKKNPGLAKLPEKVRNKMGYAKKGKIVKAALGAIALGAAASQGLKKIMKKKSSASPIMGAAAGEKKIGKPPMATLYQKATEQKKARTGKMMKANVGMAAKKVREKEMTKRS